MELFPAANEDQWTLIKNVIDDCDYYIVIVGGRYGSITVDGISYTEKEYDYAVDRGKPVLGFVHHDPGDLPVRDAETDSTAQDLVYRFRQKVLSRPSRTYGTAEQLGSVVSRSLMQAIKKEPGEGWVRGRFALTPEHAEEVNRLRAEIAELRLQQVRAKTTNGSGIDKSELAQDNDQVELHFKPRANSNGGMRDFELQSSLMTWREIFRALGTDLIEKVREYALVEIFNRALLVDVQADLPTGAAIVQIESETFMQILHQFRALGYVEITGASPHGDRLWRITPDGDAYLLHIFALRRTDTAVS